MPANANIVVADSQPTPVNHTFTPIRIKNDIASYNNYDAIAAASRETVSAQMKETSKLRTTTVVLKMPRTVVETLNGVDVPSVQDYATAKLELIVPMLWTASSAEDLAELASNLLKNALIVGMVARGEFVY